MKPFSSLLDQFRTIVRSHRLKYLTWSQISRFSQTWIVRSSPVWIAIVPIAAQISMKIQQTVNVTVLGHHWELFLKLPFSWKWFFFASLAATIAAAINASRCPEIIRDYADFPRFRNAGKGADQLREVIEDPIPLGIAADEWSRLAILFVDNWLRANPDRNLDESPPGLQRTWETMRGVHIGTKFTSEEFREKLADICEILKGMDNSDPDLDRSFWAVRTVLETSHPGWRLAATAMIGFASVGYLVVIGQNLWTVITYSTN